MGGKIPHLFGIGSGICWGQNQIWKKSLKGKVGVLTKDQHEDQQQHWGFSRAGTTLAFQPYGFACHLCPPHCLCDPCSTMQIWNIFFVEFFKGWESQKEILIPQFDLKSRSQPGLCRLHPILIRRDKSRSWQKPWCTCPWLFCLCHTGHPLTDTTCCLTDIHSSFRTHFLTSSNRNGYIFLCAPFYL